MMFRSALLSLLLVGGCDALLPSSIAAKSKAAQRLLDDEDFSWMNGYNLKYENCLASTSQASFLLCAEGDKCGHEYDSCSNGAQYIVDFAFFLDAFTEAQMGAKEYRCEMTRENCEYDDEDQCYYDAGYDDCIEEDEDAFDVQEWLECAEIEGADGNAYYVGPYCDQSDAYSIHLGVFSNEYCTTQVSDDIFKNAMGYDLPYSKTLGDSIIQEACASCHEHGAEQDQEEGDQDDDDDVLEQCEELVGGSSAKCEEGIEGGDTSGCETIAAAEANDPAVASTKSSSNGSTAQRAFLFIGLAVAILACCGLSYFCYSKYSNQKEEDPTTPDSSGPGYNIMGEGATSA